MNLFQPRLSAAKSNIILFCSLVTMSLLLYYPLRSRVLMGDDLLSLASLLNNPGQNLWDRVFVHTPMGVYRPVNHVYTFARSAFFWTNDDLYFYSNIILLSINSVFLFSILRRISSAMLPVPLFYTLFFVVHRFQHYSVLTRHGGDEMFIHFTFLLLLYALVRFHESSVPPWANMVLLAYAASVFSRENIVTAALPLSGYFFVLPRFQKEEAQGRMSRRILQAYGVAVLVIAAAYTLIRHIVVGGTSLTVPGASITIEPFINLRSYAILILNVFHLFLNESYFSGIRFLRMPLYIQILSVGFVLINIILYLRFFRSNRIATKEGMLVIVLSAIGAFLLILPAMIVKNDPKYVGMSFICMCVVYTFILAALNRRAAAFVLGYFILTVSLSAVHCYRHMDDLFYVRANRVAESLKLKTIDYYGNSLRSYKLHLPATEGFRYPLLGNCFFNVYLRDASYDVDYYSNPDAINLSTGRHIVFAYDARKNVFTDITDNLCARQVINSSGNTFK